MRHFIAITFAQETQARLRLLREHLQTTSRQGHFTSSENLHLSLAFLGDCDQKKRRHAITAMEAISFSPFTLAIDSLGRFRGKSGDLWWAGIKDNPDLISLQGQVIKELAGLDFHLDKRPFNPHITLGRQVITNEIPHTVESFSQEIHKIDLLRSTRIAGYLTYTSTHETWARKN